MGLTIRRAVASISLPALAAVAALLPAARRQPPSRSLRRAAPLRSRPRSTPRRPATRSASRPAPTRGPRQRQQGRHHDHRPARRGDRRLTDRFGITVGQKTRHRRAAAAGPTAATPDQVYAVHDFTLDGLTIRDAEFTGIFMMSRRRFPRHRRELRRQRRVRDLPALLTRRPDRQEPRERRRGRADLRRRRRQHPRRGQPRQRRRDRDRAREHARTRTSAATRRTGNVAGIFVIVLPSLPTDTTEHALIEKNVVNKNNLPNPFPPRLHGPDTPPGCVPELRRRPAAAALGHRHPQRRRPRRHDPRQRRPTTTTRSASARRSTRS